MPSFELIRRSKQIISGVIVLVGLVCAVLPVIGANGYFKEFAVSYDFKIHLRLLITTLIGPLFILAGGIVFWLVMFHGKRLPWWSGLMFLLGPIYMVKAAVPMSHDFGHVVFQECGNAYGNFVTAAGFAAGALIIGYCLLERKSYLLGLARRAD